MLRDRYPYWLANRPRSPNHDLVVTDKYSSAPAARVALADRGAIEEAIEAAVRAVEPMRALAAYERRDVLAHCVQRFTERALDIGPDENQIRALRGRAR